MNTRFFDIESQLSLGCTETFSASRQFTFNECIGSRTLGTIGFNFAKQFSLAVEQPSAPVSVLICRLRYACDDTSLNEVLARYPDSKIPYLWCIHKVMEMGERAPNHVNGMSNFAFVHSPLLTGLWAVHWFVNDLDQWVIGASAVPHATLLWKRGSRMLAFANGLPKAL